MARAAAPPTRNETTVHHHHGYQWLGPGQALSKDGPRRPQHPEFAGNKLPPLELAHWLLKPHSLIRGTFTTPSQAVEWFGTITRVHLDAFASHYDRASLEERVEAVARSVVGGDDVCGGWWLTGQRFLAVHLVACSPHRHRPEFPCPAGARTQR